MSSIRNLMSRRKPLDTAAIFSLTLIRVSNLKRQSHWRPKAAASGTLSRCPFVSASWQLALLDRLPLFDRHD